MPVNTFTHQFITFRWLVIDKNVSEGHIEFLNEIVHTSSFEKASPVPHVRHCSPCKLSNQAWNTLTLRPLGFWGFGKRRLRRMTPSCSFLSSTWMFLKIKQTLRVPHIWELNSYVESKYGLELSVEEVVRLLEKEGLSLAPYFGSSISVSSPQ
jgi:hypothetical protein